MILKNITIENFRSYYGEVSIDLGDKLTLIVGANGDGKTTLFEALEWLFDTVNKLPKADVKYVSKKMASELLEGEVSQVRVALSYINNGSERIVEKSFKFTKSLNGEISTSSFSHILWYQNGTEKLVASDDRARLMFDCDFAASIRKYCLFKGEQELNIFNKEDAMSYLVENFSQIKDFDPYIDFLNKSANWADQAHDNAIKADKKNSTEAERLRGLIRIEEQKLGRLMEEHQTKATEASDFAQLLDDVEKNKESSSLLKATNEAIANYIEQRKSALSKIQENYTFRLLDEMWILMGFEPIAKEFTSFVSQLDYNRRKLENKYNQEIGAKRFAGKMQIELDQGHVPLALNVPDEKTMREMINEEFCKVCGRPAPKGSDAYRHMKDHLDKFLESLNVEDEEEEFEPLYKHNFVHELNGKYAVLHNNMKFLTGINNYVDNAIKFNITQHQKIDQLSSMIEREEETKRKILAQTDGLSEDQLISVFENINEWWRLRNSAEERAKNLDLLIKKSQEVLDAYRESYSQISEESVAAMYGRSSKAIRKIFEAFESAKIKNKREFLSQLEKAANMYLEALNQGDFRGYAKIVEKPNNSAEITLIDSDGSRIFNPNTALKTTMYMALLFAVAKLATDKHNNVYPLIFDAPTSSFTTAKESDFFGIIGNIEKQTIIVTKSFLNEEGSGISSLDIDRLSKINAVKYRIEKKKPFNDKDLSTIQTIITRIN